MFAVAYFLCVLACAYIFYLRFPNNFDLPNFYGEDGRDYAANIINKGFLSADLTTFNGYYIWGLYLICEAAMIGNRLMGGSLIALPQAFAVASYLFIGFCVTLPTLLLRRYFRPQYIAALIIVSCLVPLMTSDYAVLGTIGNLKWLFTYVAFLLVITRNANPDRALWRIVAIDLSLLICAYTNVTTYLLVPFLLIPYIRLLINNRLAWKRILMRPDFLSLAGLGALLIPQLLVVAIHGIPPLPGYLDTPFRASRGVEIFVGRTFLYGLIYPIYRHLNDILAVVGLGGLLAGLFLFGGRQRRPVYLFGLFTALMATTVFALNRTGIGEHFLGYKTGGPDQFFYVQSLILLFVMFLALNEIGGRLPKPADIALPLAIAVVFVAFWQDAGTWGRNNFMEAGVGVFSDNAIAACARPGDMVSIQIYPVPVSTWQIRLPRSKICSDLTRYQPTTEDLGLIPDANHHLPLLTANTFRQTFLAKQDNLNGVRPFLATFGAPHLKTPYSLKIYKADCKTVVRSVDVPLIRIGDNSFSLLTFPPITNSAGKTFCFTLMPQGPPRTPLAIRLGKPGVYAEGALSIGEVPEAEDAVFEINYGALKPR